MADDQTREDAPGKEPIGQDDIDALMNAAGGGEASAEDPAAVPDTPESGGVVDQASIDALFDNGPGEGAAAAAAPTTGDSSAADRPSSAEIDQSDIDALLAGGGATEGSESGGGAGSTSAEAPAAGSQAIDQGDIDALFSGGGSDAGSAASSPAAPAPDEPAAAVDTRLDSLGRPFDEAAAAMQAAIDEENAAKAATAENVSPVELPELAPDVDGASGHHRMSMLNDVKLRVKIELGKTRMRVEDVLKLGDGSVVELDKLAGDPVDVFVNGRLIARGEVLVLNDNFCVRINEVMTADPHRVSA